MARERKLVAAVIYNRLKAGQPLGIDATIRYATGNWSQPLKQSELAIDSAYNTRTRAGLPPGPIGNPGLASLQAAARPARVGYLYYVVKPGTCGEHAFSSTDAEFARDQQRYNEAREAAGGQVADEVPVTTRVALLGHPVGHSRSPAMHNAAFRELGLDWRYEALDVEPERFAEVLRVPSRAGVRGRERHDPAQAARARGGRRRQPTSRGRWAPPTRCLRGRARARRQHRRRGLPDRPAGARARGAGGHAARSCWAPAAPRGRSSTRS